MLRILGIISILVVTAFSIIPNAVHANFAGPNFPNSQADVCGNVNDDASVNILDAIVDLKINAGALVPSDDQRRRGDLNHNARVDVGDANRTLSHIVGASPTLDECGPEPLAPLDDERAFPNLDFDKLTNLAQPDDGSNRIFVTEQDTGLIKVFPNNQQATAQQVQDFLDIDDANDEFSHADREEGLLGFAFAPDFEDSGHFFVYYSARSPRRSVISRFTVMADGPNKADPNSEFVILEVAQPFGNHNGGQLAFGPDGKLYIALGDGGSGFDPNGNGQKLDTILGTILRLDVSGTSDGKNYIVPPDNPFVDDDDALNEIWAYGLRNPWRFSFEPETGLLWAADVGQVEWEEIDIIEKGLNYGWVVMEGPECTGGSPCDQSGLELPIASYGHDEGCSVTGGYVYQGKRISSLRGAYVFGDFCEGTIWGIRYDGESLVAPGRVHIGTMPDMDSLSSFGVDLEGNLYLLSRSDGIYRFAAN